MSLRHLDVYYDGHCPFCVRSRDVLMKLDFLRLLDFTSYRQLRDEEMPLSPTEMEKAMVAVSGNKKYTGMHAFSKILSRMPQMFPFFVLIAALNLTGLGERVYRRIAAGRYSILVGRCPEDCAV